MSPFPQIIRAWVAALVGIGYLGSLPGVTLTLAAEMMDHGHEHALEVIPHGAHTDLVLHHRDHDHDHDHGHDESGGGDQEEHQHDGCHVLELAVHPGTLVPQTEALNPAIVEVVTAHFEQPHFLPWLDPSAPRLVHPPPDPQSGTLACLRTIVLRV